MHWVSLPRTCTHIHTHVHTQIYTHAHICIHNQIYTQASTHTHINTTIFDFIRYRILPYVLSLKFYEPGHWDDMIPRRPFLSELTIMWPMPLGTHRSCHATTVSSCTIVNILTELWLIERWWKRSLVVFLRPSPPVPFPLQSAVGSGSWQRVNAQTAVRSPRYAVFDLAEGKSYVFRVLSANKHGLSDPSEITPPIQAQDMIGKLWHITKLPIRLKIRCPWYGFSERMKMLEYHMCDCVHGQKSIQKWWRAVPYCGQHSAFPHEPIFSQNQQVVC